MNSGTNTGTGTRIRTYDGMNRPSSLLPRGAAVRSGLRRLAPRLRRLLASAPRKGRVRQSEILNTRCRAELVLRNAPLVHDLKATLRRCSPTEEGERSLLEAVCDLVEQMDSDAVVDPTRLMEAIEGFGPGSQVRPRIFSLRARGRTAWTDLFAPGRRRMRKSSWCLSGSS